jgi:3-phenylpropionate/trans-cinnamate dioxygenase ferredoxin reductase component
MGPVVHVSSRTFAAFYLKGNHILVADVIGRPLDFMVARKLVSAKTPVDAQRLADESIPLAQCAYICASASGDSGMT